MMLPWRVMREVAERGMPWTVELNESRPSDAALKFRPGLMLSDLDALADPTNALMPTIASIAVNASLVYVFLPWCVLVLGFWMPDSPGESLNALPAYLPRGGS
jgi:hypothetical protein